MLASRRCFSDRMLIAKRAPGPRSGHTVAFAPMHTSTSGGSTDTGTNAVAVIAATYGSSRTAMTVTPDAQRENASRSRWGDNPLASGSFPPCAWIPGRMGRRDDMEGRYARTARAARAVGARPESGAYREEARLPAWSMLCAGSQPPDSERCQGTDRP